MGSSTHPDRALIERGVRGGPEDQSALVRRLVPAIRAEVRASLRRAPGSGHADMDDLIQDVLSELIRDDYALLLRWDPERGLTLDGYLRLITRRYLRRKLVRSSIASAAEVPWSDDFGARPVDTAIELLDEVDAVLSALDLSGRDRELFDRLALEGQTVADAAAEVHMSSDAVKKWRSRFYADARRIRQKLAGTRREGPSRR